MYHHLSHLLCTIAVRFPSSPLSLSTRLNPERNVLSISTLDLSVLLPLPLDHVPFRTKIHVFSCDQLFGAHSRQSPRYRLIQHLRVATCAISDRLRQPALRWSHTCRCCGVLLLTGETSDFCCVPRGAYLDIVRPLLALPSEFNDFLYDPTISANSRKLTLLFSFTVLQTSAEFPNRSTNYRCLRAVQLSHKPRAPGQTNAIRPHWHDTLFTPGRHPPGPKLQLAQLSTTST